MNRIGFQINNSGEEDVFKKFDEYVDASKEKLTKAADKLLKLYKSSGKINLSWLMPMSFMSDSKISFVLFSSRSS